MLLRYYYIIGVRLIGLLLLLFLLQLQQANKTLHLPQQLLRKAAFSMLLHPLLLFYGILNYASTAIFVHSGIIANPSYDRHAAPTASLSFSAPREVDIQQQQQQQQQHMPHRSKANLMKTENIYRVKNCRTFIRNIVNLCVKRSRLDVSTDC